MNCIKTCCKSQTGST